MSYPADRNPMSEARRQHVHGQLSSAKPTRFDRICIAIILAVVAFAIAFAFTAASSSDPRADGSTTRVAEAGAGQGHP